MVVVSMMLCDAQMTNQSQPFSPLACAVSDTPMTPAASPEA